MNVPTISIVSGLYNTELWLWKRTLTAIKKQKYPRNRIEHIVMDAGSTNGGVELARSFGCTVIQRPDLRNRGSVRMSIGISRAKGDIILILEPDNIMVGTRWLSDMVQPFMDQPNIVGAFSMYNSAEKTMPALTRYCALIGANDPTLLYLGKSEKMPQFKKTYDVGEIIKEHTGYYVVRFTKENLPTLGDNGHMVRRKAIQSVNKDPMKFLHIQAFAQLVEKGFDSYAAVKNSIIHYSGSDTLGLASRRIGYKQSYFDVNRGGRTYYIYNYHSIRDKIRIALFSVYALTFLQPLFFSIRGYVSVRDFAWFLHPIMCFYMVAGYGWSEVKRVFFIQKTGYYR